MMIRRSWLYCTV